MDHLAFFLHQACAGFICKIEGQLCFFVRVYIAGIHDEITGCQHPHRIALAVHQGLVPAIYADIVNPLYLGHHPGQGCPAEYLPFRLHGRVVHIKIQVQDLLFLAASLKCHLIRKTRLAVQILGHMDELVHQFCHKVLLIGGNSLI